MLYISPNFSKLDAGQPLVVDFPDLWKRYPVYWGFRKKEGELKKPVFKKVLANNFALACIVVVKL